jgi:hypothetical protein
MRLKAIAFGLVLAASACTSTAYDPGSGGGSGGTGGGAAGSGGGGSGGAGGAGGAGGGGGSTGGSGTARTGTISADQTWDGLNHVTGDVTVAAGVTLTIDAGAQVQVDAGKAIIVSGTVKVTGTAASTVAFTPTQMGMAWGGIQVNSGGSATISYADMSFPSTGLSCAAGAATCAADHTSVHDYTGAGMNIASTATFSYLTVEKGGGGGIFINAAATDTVTITDSTFHITGNDAVIGDGGNITFQYNHSYGSGGATPGVHCACHFATTGTVLVDHNNFEGATYGTMIGGMSATSKFNYNNLTGDANAYGSSGSPVNAQADLSKNYWGSDTAPIITGNTTNQPDPKTGLPADAFYKTMVTGTGPR